ncbi:hypothetical protein CEXT_459821 [Caerostris extrusa]|uniref:Uncharacterized protein n=1 Tax=Caerostris extrusa TaxID=172846 RepID=A0AAV4UDR8_CAEEX|nr:hypothetical protein CEXT_459821 [Caerostris extrusa]
MYREACVRFSWNSEFLQEVGGGRKSSSTHSALIREGKRICFPEFSADVLRSWSVTTGIPELLSQAGDMILSSGRQVWDSFNYQPSPDLMEIYSFCRLKIGRNVTCCR